MSFLSYLFPRHCHPRPEHALDEVRKILKAARITNGLIMDSLKNLQDAVAAQGDLITKAETFVNTLEASTDPDNSVAAADVDAVTTAVLANNDKLRALVPDTTTPTGSTGTAGVDDGTGTTGTANG